MRQSQEPSPTGGDMARLRRQVLRWWIEDAAENNREELEALVRQAALLILGSHIHPGHESTGALLDDADFRRRWRDLLKKEEALLIEQLNRDGRKTRRSAPKRRH